MRALDRRQSLAVDDMVASLTLVGYPRQLRQCDVIAIVNLLASVEVLNVPRVLQVWARPVVSLVILRAIIRTRIIEDRVLFALTPLPLPLLRLPL